MNLPFIIKQLDMYSLLIYETYTEIEVAIYWMRWGCDKTALRQNPPSPPTHTQPPDNKPTSLQYPLRQNSPNILQYLIEKLTA